MNLCTPDLPNFFAASGSQLQDAIAVAIQCIGQEGEAGYMVVRDETCFSKSFGLCYGLVAEDAKKGRVLGGKWPDHHIVEMDEDNELPELKRSDLADVTVCTAIKRIDKKDELFAIQMLPRGHDVSALEELQSMGDILHKCYLDQLLDHYIYIYIFIYVVIFLKCFCVAGSSGLCGFFECLCNP